MKNIETNIEAIFNSINGIQKAEAPYFFITHVQTKLAQRMAVSKLVWLPKWKPIWTIPTLTILLSINIFSINQKNKNKITTSTNNIESANLQEFSDTYKLHSNYTY